MKKYEILKKYFGYEEFRSQQADIIDSILQKNDTLAILPTGGGKSLCYQIPALIFDGLTLVISPLISLMKDQVDTLNEMGISSELLNSSINITEQRKVLSKIELNEVKLLYIAPERLESEDFLEAVSKVKVSFVAVDEAHCISQWGHDFRPSYFKISRFISTINQEVVVGAFTATATNSVKHDIISRLNLKNCKIFSSGFDRPNIKFSVVMEQDSLSFIRDYIDDHINESGIIYAATRDEVERIYNALNEEGYKVAMYHAGLYKKRKQMFQEEFLFDRLPIMVATNAFGMGIDKSNVRYVIHNNMPKDIESYYQEAGRAGRDGSESEAVLIFSPKDIMTQKFLIELNNEHLSDKQIEIKQYKLSKMINYCRTTSCLRGYILNYFDDNSVLDKCDNCSNCNEEFKLVDETINAQKIISCIFKLPYSFGIKTVIGVLRGSKRKEIVSKRLDRLSTYGIMSDMSEKEVAEIINALIGDDYLIVSTGKYATISLTQKALIAIKNREKIFRKVFVKKLKEREYDIEIYNKIKDVRNSLSKEEGVPPYIIFNDKTLIELAIKQPKSREDLLKVKGFGEYKADKYGDAVLSIFN